MKIAVAVCMLACGSPAPPTAAQEEILRDVSGMVQAVRPEPGPKKWRRGGTRVRSTRR